MVAQETLLLGAGLSKKNHEKTGFEKILKIQPTVYIFVSSPQFKHNLLSKNLVGRCSTAMSLGEGGCLPPPSPSSAVL